VPFAGDDDVVENGDSQELTAANETLRQGTIFGGGSWIAARVIVCDRDRAHSCGDGVAKDLCGIDDRTPLATAADEVAAHYLKSGVESDHPEGLDWLYAQAGPEEFDQSGRVVDAGLGGGGLRACCQVKSRMDTNGACGTDALHAREGSDRGVPELSEGSEGVEQLARDDPSGVSARTGPEDECQQLHGAEFSGTKGSVALAKGGRCGHEDSCA